MTINREELEAVIRQVIAEERVESIAHPAQREKVTRYTDPDGKTWISTTLERGEIAQKIAALLIALTTIVSAANYVVSRLVLYPAIDERVTASILAHEERARNRMSEISPTLVTRAEFDAWTAEKNEKWRDQDEFNKRIEAALIEMQRDIKELLKRVR